MTDEHRGANGGGGVVICVGLMLFGAAVMLDRAGIIDVVHYTAFWGLLVTTIGIVKLSQVRPDGRREGGWWVFFGVWMLLNETRAWRFEESWPLFIVAVGVNMVWKEIAGRSRARARVE
jgi:hypothetical protein